MTMKAMVWRLILAGLPLMLSGCTNNHDYDWLGAGPAGEYQPSEYQQQEQLALQSKLDLQQEREEAQH